MTVENANHAEARAALIAEIEAEVRDTSHFLGKSALDPAVIAAVRAVPREAFVPDAVRDLAYINRPLSIGHGQTISQPYIVAVMTDMLRLTPQSRVLEIGTGCGYQTAILATIAAEVFTVEVIGPLARSAEARLADLGFRNIQFRVGDGRLGWPEAAPFDAIIVTAAAAKPPSVLIEQLGTGGRLVVPVGRQHRTQFLTRIEKDAKGAIHKERMLPVAFVPLVAGDS